MKLVCPIKEYFPHQLAMLEMPDKAVDMDIVCAVGGLGSGKTKAAVDLGMYMASGFHGSIGIVGHKYLSTLKSTVIKDYLATIESWCIPPKAYTHNKGEQTLTFHCWGDSVIHFKSLEFPDDTLRSMNADWAHIEEANLAGLNAYLKVIERVRRPGRNKTKRVVLTLNPTMRKDWIYDLFVKGAGKFTSDDGKGGTVTVHRRRVVSSTRDNKELSAVYALNLKETLSEQQYRALVLGEDIMIDSGLVLQNWSVANEDKTLAYDPERRIYLTCDFNVDPMCWALCHIGRDPATGLVHYQQFDEVAYGPTTTEEAADRVGSKYRDHRAGITVTGDASGTNRSTQATNPNYHNYKVIEQVLAGQWQIQDVSMEPLRNAPHVDARHQLFVSIVKNAAGDRLFTINPLTCPRTYHVLTNMEWVTGGEGFAIKSHSSKEIERDATGQLKYFFHPYDAVSYLVWKYSNRLKDEAGGRKQVYREEAYRARR
jgi:PBSX family phage terminase large subunit